MRVYLLVFGNAVVIGHKKNKMSNQLKNRKKLFDVFSRQLHLLKNEGLIDVELKYERTYICPICLNQFEENDLISKNNKNFLTEEDAPPAKLNGSRIALTCKECNSKAGHQIDNHLIHQLRNLDDKYYLNSTPQERRVKFENSSIGGTLTPKGNGIIEIVHKPKNNDPKLLDKFIYALKNKTIGQALNLAPRYSNIKDDCVERALLKTAYIITFSKFGYIFLLDNYYDSIRTQIKDVGAKFEKHFFLKNQFANDKVGTYYLLNPNSKAIFNIFSLKTEYSETLIGSILPLTGITPEEFHSNLVGQGYDIGEEGKIGVTLDTSHYDPDADLFNDLNEIKKIMKWMMPYNNA